MIDKDGDAAIGVEAEEPVFLLIVGHDVAEEEEEDEERGGKISPRCAQSRMGGK